MDRRYILCSATLLAVIAAAGCSGGNTQTVPVATASPGASPTSSNASPTATPTGATPSASPSGAAPTASPSSVPAATYVFGGSADTITVATGTVPAAISLAAYPSTNSITLNSIQFAAPTAGGGSLVVTDATNASGGHAADVTPNTLPADNASSSTTPLIYISLYNQTASAMTFGTQTPAISLTSPSIGADISCELDYYGTPSNGTTLSWQQTGATAATSGNNVTIPATTLMGGSTLKLNPGQNIVAVSCD